MSVMCCGLPLKEGGNYDLGEVAFDVSYYGVPWNDLTFELGEAHFGVDGTLTIDCPNDEYDYEGDVYQKDLYSFPHSVVRDRFKAYRAGEYLQSIGYNAFSVLQKWTDRQTGHITVTE